MSRLTESTRAIFALTQLRQIKAGVYVNFATCFSTGWSALQCSQHANCGRLRIEKE